MQVSSRARALAVGTLAAAVLITSSAAAPAPAQAATPADKVISIAKAQLGEPWVWAAEGPNRFDCSGLVIYAFKQAGYGAKIGNGRYRSGYAMYKWFRDRGLATRSNPQKGDIVVWGGGSHVGIYIGGGKAISTLTSGVRIHGVHAVTARFTAYLRTGLSGGTATATTAVARTSTASSVRDIADHLRLTTARLNLRSGPSTGHGSYAVLGYRSKVKATGYVLDRSGRTWFYVWSYAAGRGGWVAGWYTRKVV